MRERSIPKRFLLPVRPEILIGVALVILVLGVYWQVGSHGFLTYDDDLYVVNNPQVRQGLTRASIAWAFSSVEHCNWHPVTWLSHMLDVQLYGLNPRGHHLTNVILHTLATLLLHIMLYQQTGAVWRSSFVAALFAVHPLHVESVAWVAERKDVLSACLGFLTLLLYGRYAEARRSGATSCSTRYLAVLVAFVLGLMAKPMLVTLPLVMLLLDYWPLQRIQPPVRPALIAPLVGEKIPFFACSLLSSAITVYAQQQSGAVVSLDWIPFGIRLQNALVSYLGYIAKTLWPHDLAVLYPFSQTIPLWQAYSSGAALLLVSAAAIRAGYRHPYLPVGWFWFLVTLLPVIGLVQVGNQAMADRYAYIPGVGLFIMLAWGVPSLCRSVPGRQLALTVIAPAAIIASAAVTWHQIGYWRDDISLYRHTLDVTTGNYVINYNLGIAYARSGNRNEAIRQFRAAVAIKPADSRLRNLLAATLAESGDLDGAIAEYRRSLAINPGNREAAYALEYWCRQKGVPACRGE